MKRFVFSVGGSVIVPDGVNADFINGFKELIAGLRNYEFGVVCGGGHTAREYAHVPGLSAVEADNLGIMATRINAQLISYSLGKLANPKVFMNVPAATKAFGKRVVVMGGTKAGHTTDFVAAELAARVNAELINLTNVKGVYDKDPRKYRDAKLLRELSWTEFFERFRVDYAPSMNFVFEPQAAKLCAKKGIKVIVLDGNDLKNLRNALTGKEFIGTTIE